MFKPVRSSRLSSVINLALLLSCCLFVFPEQIWAKNKNENSNSSANEGLPVRRVGGGTRRECVPPQTSSPANPSLDCSPLIALIPENLVITSTESPTLLFYIPAINNSNRTQVEFVLRNSQDQLVYETTFSVSGKAGIINYKIPTTKSFKGLNTQENYHWYLSIIYNSSDRAHDAVVEGWVRYNPLPSALASQLAKAPPLEQVQLYQKNNLWHEALNTLAQLKQAHPDDRVISQMWTELLQSLNLDLIATEPLIDGVNHQPRFPISTNSSHLMGYHPINTFSKF